jgi:CO/xanthine dehydrogenase FAD-binding subunit
LACAAARIKLDDAERIADARIFVGAVGPRPQRISDAEALLVGKSAHAGLAADFDEAIAAKLEDIPDPRCSASYKRRVVGVLVRRAVAEAVDHAAGRRLHI